MFKSCLNTECENGQLYDDIDPITNCPLCSQPLEVFVDDEEEINEEDYEDGDPEDKEWLNDND